MLRRVESPGAASRRGRGEDEGRAAAKLPSKGMANGPFANRLLQAWGLV